MGVVYFWELNVTNNLTEEQLDELLFFEQGNGVRVSRIQLVTRFNSSEPPEK
jgi:hypothetical protein